MSESGNSSDWFSKVILALIAIGVAALLVWLGMPSHITIQLSSPRDRCIHNLRLIDGAVQEWAMHHNKADNDVATWADLSPYLGTGTNVVILECPSGGTYTLGSRTNIPTCSIPDHRPAI